jgi:RNA polymerase sigma factor (sigma-70 family)
MADKFATTRWSLILAATRDDEGAHDALEELCEAYWRPVYTYMRRHGHVPEEAADLTQAFFLQVLERRSFTRADPAKGRFRSYLLTSARNFLINAREHDHAVRRGGQARHEAIELAEAERYLAQDPPAPDSSPHTAFERQWAIRLMERALERLRTEYAARGRERVFQRLQPLLTSNSAPDTPPRRDAAASSMSPEALRAAVHRLRRRFAQALRAEISETVGDIGDVDDELRYVLRVLGA